MVFNNYARYYDLLYKEKNYEEETNYIINIIRKYKPDANSILDLGCGTGKHDSYLYKNGYKITGVDISDKMVDIAKKNYPYIEFYNQDIRKLSLDRKYDVMISLFHVMSYQITNSDLVNTINSIFNHLNSGGLLIFDFWYGPAVLTDRPVIKVKKFEDEEIRILRIAIPEMHPNDNVVDVNYEVMIEDKKTRNIDRIIETHRMRYLFIPELLNLLEVTDFQILNIEEWLTGKVLNFSTWNGLIISKKK